MEGWALARGEIGVRSSELAPGTFALYDRYPELRETLPRLALGKGPSPVVPLTRLSSQLGGPSLWVKNDGLYGGVYGGNKARKLEFILADALRRGSRTIITFGAIGTNHGLATALYAREQGLRTVLLLVDQPVTERVRAQVCRLHQSGAVLHRTRTVPRTAALAPLMMLRYIDWRRRRLPYLLPTGGSSPLGAVGFVNAALELADQIAAGELPEPAHIFVALGSGGTAAGLLLGLRLAGLRSRLVAVVVSDVVPMRSETVTRLANRTAKLLRRRGAPLPPGDVWPEEVALLSDWLGGGYGHPTLAAARAEELARETEGLELEGVYTAKTVAALVDLVEAGRLQEGPVLYWHTFNALPLPFGPPTAEEIQRLPRAFRSLTSV
jgi:D-cysteine desulfhydrase